MKCPNCHQAIDQGAAFCGNCGQPLQATPAAATPSAAPIQPTPFAQAFNGPPPPKPAQNLAPMAIAGAQGAPAYAFATPATHRGDVKSTLAIILGCISIPAALIPIVGLALAIAGIVLGSMSHATHKKTATAGIIISTAAILLSLGSWVYNVQANGSTDGQSASSSSGQSQVVAANGVTTPCYEASFATNFNITTKEGNCDMTAFDGSTLEKSTNAYKIYGYEQSSLNSSNFTGFAKTALEKDIHDNLPGYTIGSEKVGQFANKQAYIVNATNKESGAAYVEAAVLQSEGKKNNLFVFVHVVVGDKTDLSELEGQWQWK